MKTLVAIVAAITILAGSNAYAAKPPAAGMRITKITGTVNLMKDGLVVMTLKPGDALPTLTDTNVTFAVVDGTIEMEAGGEKITAATGSNFTVNADNAASVKISVTEGAPVEIKGAGGNNVLLSQNTEVSMNKTNGNIEITVDKGSAMVTNLSGAAPQTMNAGEKMEMPAALPAPAIAPADPVSEVPMIVAPPFIPETTVIETQTVQESCEVSSSSPACN